jgi:dTDP-4-amino-4,6-dideoxygalactose transaminase
VFADIDPKTLNIDPSEIERRITSRTKAILPVHFGGLPCDMGRIQALAFKRGIAVVEDAAHAAGAVRDGEKIGGLGNPTCFSFYPNKNMTTVEGGMLTTNDERIAERAKSLRLHGLNQDAWKRYLSKDLLLSEVSELGYKYNLTDIQAAIGLHQLRKLDSFIATREKYAAIYDDAFKTLPGIFVFPRPLPPSRDRHALHLYLLSLDRLESGITRDQFVVALRKQGIGAAIHYVPLHLHPFYRTSLGCKAGDFPVSERIAEGILTLPLSPAMSPADVARVVQAVRTISLDSGRSAS